ncbi:TetR/AcrR family transcriptional regulator [Mycolicibacterium wolinskyi]|uniref:TetR/AcrR family transcriptional regulator n=1 Tax=Mycolicibacterium wolinskyi TaxID=59750 RepID=UPI003BA8E487
MRPVEDVTARARIRDAAMRLFAEHGVKETTIRTIAAEANVAPGLVSHHFGNKQGLREACDGFVMDYLRRVIAEGVDGEAIADPGYLADVYRGAPIVLRYVSRALVDESPGATRLFDNLVALTEDYLTTHPPQGRAAQQDLRTLAAVHVAMRLGVWVMHPHLIRVLGADALTPQVLTRISAAVLDAMSPDLAGADLMSLARNGLNRYQQEEQ